MTRRLSPFRAEAPFSFSGARRLTVQLLHEAPKKIVAGDSIDFLVAIPSDLTGWTGSARLTGPGQMNGTVATDGADFRVTFAGQSAAGTKNLAAGQYTLTVWATSGDDRYTVAQYPVTVEANLAVGTPAQRHALIVLPKIEAAIAARLAGGEIESYSVDGVNIAKVSLEVLERMRSKYSAEVAAMNGVGAFGSVKFAFSPTGSPMDQRGRYS